MSTSPETATPIQLTNAAPLTPPATPSLPERIQALKQALPERFEPFTDKYFLRTHEVINKERLNPFVRDQVFIGKGPGEVAGIEESL